MRELFPPIRTNPKTGAFNHCFFVNSQIIFRAGSTRFAGHGKTSKILETSSGGDFSPSFNSQIFSVKFFYVLPQEQDHIDLLMTEVENQNTYHQQICVIAKGFRHWNAI